VKEGTWLNSGMATSKRSARKARTKDTSRQGTASLFLSHTRDGPNGVIANGDRVIGVRHKMDLNGRVGFLSARKMGCQEQISQALMRPNKKDLPNFPFLQRGPDRFRSALLDRKRTPSVRARAIAAHRSMETLLNGNYLRRRQGRSSRDKKPFEA